MTRAEVEPEVAVVQSQNAPLRTWRDRLPRAVVRPHRVGDPRRLVGSITHGGPNQWKCGPCDGTGDHIEVYQSPLGGAPERSVEACEFCNGEGWYVHGR